MSIDILTCIIYGIQFSVVALILFCLVLYCTTQPFPVNSRAEDEKYFLNPDGKKVKFPTMDEPWTLHLSVVVPAYDEELRLPKMLEECISFLETRPNLNYEVIVVSDGSRDKTVQVAMKFTEKYGAEKVRVLELVKNRGKGGAVKMGIENSRGALILFADADGATKFSDLEKLENSMSELVKSNYLKDPANFAEFEAIVCGSRAHLEKESIATRSFFRTFLMYGFHFLVWLFTVRNIKDTQCGFKLLTRNAARICFSSLHVERWAFDVELLLIAQKLKIPIKEVAVNWTEIEGSKIVPFWSALQMGKDLFLIWLRYHIGAWKIAGKKGI